MATELLLDHTAIHSIQRQGVPPGDISLRSRELLQVVEQLLFADTIWVCDSVTPETQEITCRFHDLCAKAGLADARNDGLFRIASFSKDQLVSAANAAAPNLNDVVLQLGLNDLRRLGARSAFELRPAGAQRLDYPSLAAFEFGSDAAKEYASNALNSKGWLPSSVLPLLNSDLFRWFRPIAASANNRDDRAWEVFNALSRWMFNNQLAHLIQPKNSASTFQYAPAFGRAALIDQASSLGWLRTLELLERKWAALFRQDPKFVAALGELTAPKIRLPVFGVWVMMQLPENCSLEALLQKISECRISNRVKRVRSQLSKWVPGQTMTDHEVEEIAKEVFSEVKLRFPSGFKPKAKSRQWKAVVKIPVIPSLATLESSEEFSGSSFPDKLSFFRGIFTPTRTLLSGFFEDAFSHEDAVNALLTRTKSIFDSN